MAALQLGEPLLSSRPYLGRVFSATDRYERLGKGGGVGFRRKMTEAKVEEDVLGEGGAVGDSDAGD